MGSLDAGRLAADGTLEAQGGWRGVRPFAYFA